MGRISKELLEKLPCSGEEVSYTVRVDCSGRNLTSFPTLPSDSTVLDLSHNLLDQVGFVKLFLLTLSQAAYEDLDVVRMNYINLRSLILSHNRYVMWSII